MRSFHRSPAAAWVTLCLAVAVHVTDEALNDFLSLYNPVAQRIRERLPFLPLPLFTFETWITGLVLAILLALSLTPLVRRRARWVRPVVVAVSGLMILNALGHMVGTLRMDGVMPGTYSAPLLLVAALWSLERSLRGWSDRHSGPELPYSGSMNG